MNDDHMNDIERELGSSLRDALRRKEPPPGFARRVMERVTPAPGWTARRWQWVPAAVAASLLLSVSGVYWQRQRQAEQAKDQLLEALQITAQKIALVERVAARNLNRQERYR